MKRRVLALFALAFLAVGPQGLAGWKHATLHDSCTAPASRHGAPCAPASGDVSTAHSAAAPQPVTSPEMRTSGCWICEALLLTPAAVASPPAVHAAPIVAHHDAPPAAGLRAASLPPSGSPRAPPLS